MRMQRCQHTEMYPHSDDHDWVRTIALPISIFMRTLRKISRDCILDNTEVQELISVNLQ